jgi:hypothetical protein
MAVRALHLCVLWSFAIVAPLFDELGRHAEFFVVRGNTRSDILIVAFGLTLIPPLVLWLVVAAAARIRRPLGEALHVGLVGLLLAVFALDLLERAVSATAPLLVAAGVIGAAGAAAYVRVPAARAFLTALSPAPAVFLVALLVFSPVRELLTVASAEARRSSIRSNTPIVLAIFDELPTMSLMEARGQIDAAGFPNFGRLARTSTWYRNATTVADGTQLAVPSIFSGRRPTSNLPTARRYPDSIFTLLGGRHELHVLEPITHVCGACEGQRPNVPRSQRLHALLSDLAIVQGHLLLPPDLAARLPPIDRDFEDFGGQHTGVDAPTPRRSARPDQRRLQRPIAGGDLFADRLREAERFVRRVRRPRARPPAHVAHFIVPHVPWRLLPSGHQYPVQGPTLPGSTDRVWSRDRFLVEQAMQRHLLQVGYADRLLGRLVARLKAADVWERALVVVTADHGIGLRPGGSRREIKREDFAGIAGVPLFIKRPGQRASRIDDAPARSIDVMPTIASIIGARDWPRFDGVSLAARDRSSGGDARLRVRRGRSGKLVSIGLDEFVRARDAELTRQRRSFPRGLRSVFRIGPNRQLLGRRVRSLPISDGPPQVRIGDDAFAHVDHHSGVVPAYVTGYFRRPASAGLPLAVAVNDRIVAVGQSYPVRDMTRFSMLVPPTSLRPGGNLVEVFRVTASGLLRLGRTPS